MWEPGIVASKAETIYKDSPWCLLHLRRAFGGAEDLVRRLAEVHPTLLAAKNGLGFTQLVGENNIKTVIFHVTSGESIETITNIPQDVVLKGMNDFQVLGSAITYIRRYALSSALGLITDKDTDAGGEQTKKLVAKVTKPILKAGSKEYRGVFDGLRNGFKMEQVKTKYEVSKEIETQLLKELGNDN